MPYLLIFIGIIIGGLLVYGAYWLAMDTQDLYRQFDAILERAKSAKTDAELGECEMDLRRLVKARSWHRRIEERALVVQSYITGRREGLRYQKANP